MGTAINLDEVVKSEDNSLAFHDYEKFIDHLDERINLLLARHGIEMKCGVGCDDCCKVSRTVLPVEALRIMKALRNLDDEFRRKLFEHASGNLNSCPLLVGGVCSVYEARPVICRTHGHPVLVDTGEEVGVDYCRSNFLVRDHAEPFDKSEVLDMLLINDELYKINSEFIGTGLQSDARIDLLEILSHSIA